MTPSPAYGPRGYGNNKMVRHLALLEQALKGALENKNNVMRTPNSHRLSSVSRAKHVRRVKARRPNNK